MGNDGYLDLAELKIMMEKLGAPQTHLGLKAMITEVDEDNDGKISFREFLLIYRKAKAGELTANPGLEQLARLTEINVDEVGVCGAKNFFEAKIEQHLNNNKFENEIRYLLIIVFIDIIFKSNFIDKKLKMIKILCIYLFIT